MMVWAIKELFKNDIDNWSDTDDHERFVKSIVQKEFAILDRLRMEKIDITGTLEEVEDRLKNNSIYIMSQEEFEMMRTKALKYDAMMNALRNEEEKWPVI